MLKTTVLTSLLLAGAPLVAQTTQPAGPAAPEAQTPPTTTEPSSTTAPTTSTTTPSTSQPTTTPAPASGDTATTTTASTDQVTATVDADWAKYDADSSGTLTRTELSKWLTDLQSASGGQAPTKSYLNNAFKKADSDKNKSVSKEELASFLKG